MTEKRCVFFFIVESVYIYTQSRFFIQINIVIHLKNIKCLTKPEPHRTSLHSCKRYLGKFESFVDHIVL